LLGLSGARPDDGEGTLRVDENDKIVTRYMADQEVQDSGFLILARELFAAVRAMNCVTPHKVRQFELLGVEELREDPVDTGLVPGAGALVDRL
jgi:hypothetical protein